MSSQHPTYLKLEDAVTAYGIEQDLLTRAIERGLVRAIRINGHLAVAESDVRRLSEERTPEAVPRYIPLAEAFRRFPVSWGFSMS